MRILENVKLNLFKIFALIGIGYLLSSCIGSGTAYTSKICSYNCKSDYQYYIEVSNDRRKVRYVIKDAAYGLSYSNWVDIKTGGVSYITTPYGYSSVVFEIKGKQFRVNYGGKWGNWANICESDYSYAKVTYSTGAYDSVKVEVNNGQTRLCYQGWWGNYRLVCGNWVNFDYSYVCQECPQGYTYNSIRNICEANPICSDGTYDPVTKKCYIGDFTCPLGNYDCLTLSDGKNYCSPNSCADASTSTVVDDTIQGANDRKNDGEVDENGRCLGTVYIFNGNDRRCRPPGTQTVFNNCCSKDKITLLGLVNLGKCNSDEVVLAGLRNSEDGLSQCHYIGEYCAERFKFPGGSVCIQKKKTFCCFGSILSRIIQEQGRAQLGISWGTPRNPNCRGFTPEEFQNIDFGKIDFSEYKATISRKAVENINVNDLNNSFSEHINDVFNK